MENVDEDVDVEMRRLEKSISKADKRSDDLFLWSSISLLLIVSIVFYKFIWIY